MKKTFIGTMAQICSSRNNTQEDIIESKNYRLPETFLIAKRLERIMDEIKKISDAQEAK